MFRPSLLRFPPTALIAPLFLLSAAVAPAAILYQENFENTAGADRSMRFVDWQVACADSFDSPVLIPSIETANHYAVVNPDAGTGKAPGYVWMSISPSQIRILTGRVGAWPAVTVERMKNGRVTFDAVGSTAIASISVLIQLDNKDWYFSVTEFVPPAVGTLQAFEAAVGPSGSRHTLPFSPQSRHWQKLDLVADKAPRFTVLDRDLPATASITGLGFLIRNTLSGHTGVTVRLDSLALESAKPGP